MTNGCNNCYWKKIGFCDGKNQCGGKVWKEIKK